MNTNDKQLPNETVLDDAELATAQGGVARTVDWKLIVELLEPPPSPTFPPQEEWPWHWNAVLT